MRWIVLALVASCGFPKPNDVAGPPDVPAGDFCCQLLASEPGLAKTGDTLTLEGAFDPDVVITFPGGEVAPVTVLGPHRATVVVPASATTGELTMTYENAAAGATPFRRIAFAPALASPFMLEDPQASGARQEVSLTQLRSGATAITVGGYVYVIGGSSAGTALGSVERAALSVDGTLGPFAIVPGVTLATARSQHRAETIGGYVYVIGGFDGVGAIATVERSPIVDGALGPFEVVASALATPRAEMTSAVIGDWLYVVGGTDETQPLGTIERAGILPDGSLDAFATVPNVALVTARKGHTNLVTEDGLYVFAGESGGPIDMIERIPITATGDLGPSASATVPNTATPRYGAVGIGLANAYCLIGGDSGTVRKDAECAPIASDGTFGMFSAAQTTMIANRIGATSVLVANNLFVMGGDAMTSQVERVAINTGLFGAFTVATSMTTPMPSIGQTLAVVGDSVYLKGENAFERARVPDGSLGLFGAASATPIAQTYSDAMVVIGDYLYVIGGTTALGNVSRVERALINPDGSLAPFATVTGVTLTKPRQGHVCVIFGNALYVIAGISGTSTQQFEGSVERATINADGSISTFAIVPGVTVVPRTAAAAVVIGDSIYVIGGRDGSGAKKTVDRIETNPDRSLSGVVPQPPITAVREAPGLAVSGGYIYVFGGDNGGSSLNTIERASITSGVIDTFTLQTAKLKKPRTGITSVELGNDLYIIGVTTDRSVEQAEFQ